MNAFSIRNIFTGLGRVVPLPANTNYRYHLVQQADSARPIPLKLTMIDQLVFQAEIPGADGKLKKDWQYYEHLVNDRAEDAWPQISATEFRIELILYQQYLKRKPTPEAPGLSAVS